MQARNATYTSHNPDRLATVETDGSGVVIAVRLLPTISRRPATATARAVQLAYTEAEAHRMAALQEVGRLARAGGGDL